MTAQLFHLRLELQFLCLLLTTGAATARAIASEWSWPARLVHTRDRSCERARRNGSVEEMLGALTLISSMIVNAYGIVLNCLILVPIHGWSLCRPIVSKCQLEACLLNCLYSLETVRAMVGLHISCPCLPIRVLMAACSI